MKDFDWFLGDWGVKHRRLRARFAGSNDWEEFEGTTRCQALLGGVVNLNESRGRRESGAKAEGAAGLILSTGVENRPAQDLYEAMGWVRETRFYEYGRSLA